MKDLAVVAFGRFNPTTIGHEKLLDAQHKIARRENGDMFTFMSQTQNAKKDPLEHSQKVKFAKKLMPKHASHIMNDKSVRTIFDMMKNIEDRGYERVIVIAGSDRVPEYQKLLGKYNGKDYEFAEIRVVSAGERDPDADGASGMSASKMRGFAVSGDFAEFRKGLPGRPNENFAKEIYNAVRTGLKIEEGLQSMKSFKQFVSEEFPPKKDDEEEKEKEGGEKNGDDNKEKEDKKIGKSSERKKEKISVGKEEENILVHPTPKEEETGEQDDRPKDKKE